MLTGIFTGSPAWAQYQGAPTRLNGSVSSATAGGASRLSRPQSVNQGLNNFSGAVNNNFAPQAAPQREDHGSLLSASDQAAFSQVQQPQVPRQAANFSASDNHSNINAGNTLSAGSKFDADKALRLGAQIANQFGIFGGRSSANQSLIGGAASLAQPPLSVNLPDR